MDMISEPALTPQYLPKKPFLTRLSELLGLPSPLHSELELAHVAQAGLMPAIIDKLMAYGFNARDLAFIIPPRTLSHRRVRNEKLTVEETDRVVRVARVMALAETVFGNIDKARRWLYKPRKAFGGATAMAMIHTEIGARLVEEMLIRVDEGYAA